MIAPASPQHVNDETPDSYTSIRVARWLARHATRALITFAGLVPTLGVGTLQSGCGESEDSPRFSDTTAEPSDPLGSASWAPGPSCEAGATETCSLVLGEHSGIVSCYAGTRTCQAGAFGPCENGETYQAKRANSSEAGSFRLLALSDPINCENNPCNSYCREFNEVPDDGITADAVPMAPPLESWNTGNLSDYPPEWVVVGSHEPCQVAGDCQFNSACSDPSLGSCSHSACVTGEPLVPGCNRCADTVCAIEPDCCATPPACTHDPCSAGTSAAPLDPACDTCVEAVCAVHPECCDTSWNSDCVGYVATECAPLGQTCGCPANSLEVDGACYLSGDRALDQGTASDACLDVGVDWRLLQIEQAEENDVALQLITRLGVNRAWLGSRETQTDEWSWLRGGEVFFINDATGGSLQSGFTFANWASGRPVLGAAGRGLTIADDGTWYDEPLGLEFEFLCEGPPDQLGPKQTAFSWGQECVDLVATECGVECPSDIPLGLGSCVARVATELDPNCPTFDLALGATCEDAGVPQIPVCNHGQTAAPAGLRLSFVSATQMGSVAPDLTAAGDCVLGDPIPPGRCITVTDCPGLTADSALVVNPINGAENTDECRLDDNWTIYQPVACRTPICESHVYDGAQVEREGCSVPDDNPLNVDTDQALVTLSAAALEPRCGTDEVRWGSSCYFFSSDVLIWDDALDRCRNRGGGWDLVALNSPAENKWVREETDPGQDVQIGFNDKSSEGDHLWSNGTCRSFTNWELVGFEPNNFPPGSEQCVRMTQASGNQWEDKPCNDGDHPYVCEGPVQNARGGCAAGQISGPDGNCYAFDPTVTTFAAALDACAAVGSGWGMVVIDDEATNDFVTGLLNCTPTWLSNPPGAFSNWAPAESVNLSNAPYVDEVGLWHTAIDTTPRGTLCQGPGVATGAPALTQVDNAADCTATGMQYYFEGSNAAPEALTLCANACDLAAAVPGRRLDVEIPCLPPVPPVQETTVDEMYYTADCDGGGALWDFLLYDSVTPADSRIDFEIRTAPSIADLLLDTEPWVPVASAHAIPTNTQRCEFSPSSGCPIDIFSLLGSPAQTQTVLELRVILVPGTNGEGPLLRDWRVRFSCPPSQ